MKLSVVIPTLNKVALLKQTLAALAAQDLDPDVAWEIVVVNDGSSDATAELLAALGADGSTPALVVVSPGRNVGRACARNLGARAARGRWLLFLDDDIVAPPGLLRAHLDLLGRFPQRGTIGFARTDPELIDAPHFHYLDTRGAARLGDGEAPARFFVTQNAAVPRDAFLQVGGFDENFSAYGFEDMELAFRLEDRGGVVFLAMSEPVPRHVHHHTLQEYFDKKVECGRLSLPLLAELHPGRLREMRLHHVVDPAGGAEPGPGSRILRWFAESAPGRRFPVWLGRWPVRSGHRPALPGLYMHLMNLAVLCCFRQGVVDSRKT